MNIGDCMLDDKDDIEEVEFKLESKPECANSPDGFHAQQTPSVNTTHACKYCGKLI